MQKWEPSQRAQLDLSIADFRRWNGDSAGARQSYEAAADAVREKAESAHPDPDALVLLAIAHSGLGDRDTALRYASQLADAPLAVDTVNGAAGKECLARTLARLGDHDAAIAAVERAIKEPSP